MMNDIRIILRQTLPIRGVLGAAVLLALPLAACGDTPLASRGPRGALRFEVLAATSGYVPCNGEVPVTVRVTDELNRPVRGVLLNFHAVGGTGSFFAGSGITSDSGVVKDYWTVGGTPNTPYSFEARAVDPVTGNKIVYFRQTVVSQTRLAFASNRDGNWELYAMNPDGLDVRRLTNNAASDIHVVWSPDASRLAFASNRDGNYEIYTMAADGTDLQRLTNNTAADLAPTWSPTGNYISFVSRRDGIYKVYRMNVDGSNQVRGGGNDGGTEANPAWGADPASSPTSLRLAYTSNVAGNNEIYAVTGFTPARLTNHPAEDDEAAWSPDGAKLAFMSTRDGNREIYVMSSNGTGVTRLTTHAAEDRSPAWSPDGGRIVFVSGRDGKLEVYSVKADGTDLQRVTNTESHEDNPAWSTCAS